MAKETPDIPNHAADQYKELCSDSRHIDNRLWIIPTAAYTVSLLATKEAFESSCLVEKLLFSFLAVLVFAGFLYQFARYLAYQVRNNQDIQGFEDNKNFREVIHLCGLNSLSGEMRWFVDLAARRSSGEVMFYVMLVTLAGYVTLVVSFAVPWLATL